MDLAIICSKAINVFIPRGSVVAEQNQFRKVQNLCSKKLCGISLQPYQRESVNVDCFFMGLDFNIPNGEQATFTALRYCNMPQNLDQSKFWKWANHFTCYCHKFH